MSEAQAANSDEAQIAAALVERIGRGDGAAETELWNRYSRGLLFLLRQRTGDPELAADLRQETFRVAIEKLRAGSLQEPHKLAAYIRGIGVNLATGDWRKLQRRNTWADSETVEATPDELSGPARAVDQLETATLVRQLLEELTVSRDREILLRFYVQEQDKADICADLGIGDTHFNRVLFRAKQRFRELVLRAERAGKLSLVEQ